MWRFVPAQVRAVARLDWEEANRRGIKAAMQTFNV
jgi:hypothetical protein